MFISLKIELTIDTACNGASPTDLIPRRAIYSVNGTMVNDAS